MRSHLNSARQEKKQPTNPPERNAHCKKGLLGCIIFVFTAFTANALPETFENVVPEVVCPDNMTVNTDPGLCSAEVTFAATETVGVPASTITYSHNPGTVFPKGTTMVTATAINSEGSDQCSFTITVIDNEAPEITCPPDITVNNIAGLCNAPVTIISQDATDNCSNFVLGTGLKFDGVDDVAKVAASSPINTQTLQKRTAEVYFRVNDKNISSRKQVIWEEGGTNNGLNIYVFNGSLYFGIYSLSQGWNGVWVSTGNIQSGQWHNAVLVYDGTLTTQRLKAYLDGVLVASADASSNLGAALSAHPQSNAVGALDFNGRFHDGVLTLSSGHYFGGDIDEIRLWSVARTPAQLAATNTVQLQGNEPGLVVYYNFDQGIACGNNTGLNFLDDLTATNLNGTLSNFSLNGSCNSNWTHGSPAVNNTLALINNYTGTASASGTYPVGTTIVTWTATDPSGNSNECMQTVTVVDNAPPTITCPANITVNTAPGSCAATNPSLGAPTVNDNCSGATSAYDAPAAYVIGANTVTWTVTDAAGNSTSCTQTVTVADNQLPTITCPGNMEVNTDAGVCEATTPDLGLPTTGDNCSGETATNNAPASFAPGANMVTWTVTDAAGNTATCAQTITVTDIELPTITCPATVIAEPDAGECFATGVMLGAAVSDDNCGVLSTVNNAVSTTFNAGNTTVIWTVTDLHGNTNTCMQLVTVNPCNFKISGNIEWENNNAAVKDVTVALQNLPTLSSAGSVLTDVSGIYSFSVMPGGSFRVKPAKNLNLLNGVNAADATRIQQHVANNPPLAGAYKRIAADVNKSNSITTYDATLITQALAGNSAALLLFNTSWRFVPASHVFTNPNIPWGFPEKIDINNIAANMLGQNFIGGKLGDVNGSADPQMKPGNPVSFVLNDAVTEAGKEMAVTVSTANFEDIAAFQMALDFDPSVLSFENVLSEGALEMTEDNFGVSNAASGELRAVWSAAAGKTLANDTRLFTFRFKALRDGYQLSDVLTIGEKELPAACWNTALDATGLQLLFNNSHVTGTPELNADGKVYLLQNQPNPFISTTTVGFHLPQAGEARLRIFDINGKLLLESGKYYPAGLNYETIDLQGRAGLFSCELITPYGVAVKKMIGAGK